MAGMTSDRTADLRAFTFGPFRLDLAERQLTRSGKRVPLAPKLYETLEFLVENRGRVVEKSEMLEKLWHDSFVEEGSLSQNVFQLRKVLKTGSTGENYIETIPKCGYRFAADVRVVDDWRSGGSPVSLSSLAVMPFTVLGISDGCEEHLGVGFADAIIVRLSSLKRLTVIPTRTILKYANRFDGVREIAREHGVDAVLHGTIQSSDDRFRVSLQLVSLRDNETLWSGKIDEQSGDIFAVQDSISQRVATAVMPELNGRDLHELTKHGTLNTKAYEAYSIGIYLSNKRTRDALERAVEYFEKAVGADPQYALAYAGLADVFFWIAYEDSCLEFRRGSFERSRRNALMALDLDPTIAEAHAALATVQIKHDRDPIAAEASFGRAVSLNPNSPMALSRYTYFLAAVGRLDEALQMISHARESDPLSPDANASAAFILFLLRRYEEAIEYCHIALALEPDSTETTLLLGRIYEQKQRFDEAEAEYRKAKSIDRGSLEADELLCHLYAVTGSESMAKKILSDLLAPGNKDQVRSYNIAPICHALGQTRKAKEWLKRPFVNWTERMRMLRFDPRLEELRRIPEFRDLLTDFAPVDAIHASQPQSLTKKYMNWSNA